MPGGLLLAVLAAPLSLWAQTAEPPPLHPFDLAEEAPPAEESGDDFGLIDFYQEMADGASPQDSGYAPLPSLPPSTPVQAAQATAETAPPPIPTNSYTAPLDLTTPVTAPPAAPVAAGSDDQVPPVIPPATPPAAAPEVYIPTADDPPGADPFAPPAPAPAEAAGAPLPEGGQTFSLGQSGALPSPQWANAPEPLENSTPHQFIGGAPQSQYDASQSQWQSLEVGQADRVSNVPTPTTPSRPSTVPTAPLPPTGGSMEQKVDAAIDATIDAAMDQTAPVEAGKAGPRALEPEGRENLRLLFSDMLPAQPAGTPAAADPVDPAPSAPAADPEEDEGNSAILKAGGLLTTERYGQAGLLSPLSGAPARTAAPAASAPTVPAPAKTPPAAKSAAKTDGGPAPAAKPAAPTAKAPAASSGAQKTPKKTAQAPAVAASGIKLMIINETGNDQVGELYRSVLAKIGYNVVSVGNRPPGGGQTGRTVINYRPGMKTKARTVARHLPGQKVLVEAKKGQTLAQEIMIYIK